MDDLYTVIDNLDKDNSFEVLEVLKENSFEKTEKVRALNGNEYIRKYFFHGTNYSKEKLNAISKLIHPNLPSTHDSYELADCSVIIQDFIHGRTLSQTISSRSLDVSTIVEIGASICDAVEYMHSQTPNPLIHRDIKPDNIIIDNNGNIKLIDFGAIREFKKNMNKDTVYLGTPGYASPEQFGFRQTDKRTDIYAIGMTMKHMLTGNAPDRDGLDNEPVVTNELIQIIDRATQFDPDNRYSDAKELKSALSDFHRKIQQRPTINKKYKAPGYSDLSKQSAAAVKKKSPFNKNFPSGTKKSRIVVHLLIISFFLYFILVDVINPSGYGKTDDLLVLGENLTMVTALFCCYIMGFNLFNINTRFKFFHKNRRSKKIIIGIILLTLAGFILNTIEPFHSEMYNLANSADS